MADLASLWVPAASPYHGCNDDRVPAGCVWQLGLRASAAKQVLRAAPPHCIVGNPSLHPLHLEGEAPPGHARVHAANETRANEARAMRQLKYFRAEHRDIYVPTDVVAPLLTESLAGNSQPPTCKCCP